MISFSDLHAGYGSAADAVAGVTMSVPEAGVVGIVGANGSGKSTLLKALAGLVPVRSGEVLLNGESLVGVSAAARVKQGIVLLPEGHRVIPNLTIEENLALAAISKWPGRAGRHLKEVLPSVYDLFPVLSDRRASLAGFLSGGQQQMLALGRSLVSAPRVLLLDEPSLGLAPVVIDRIYDSLLVLKERGLSLLIVEQGVERLQGICDNYHVMRLGTIVASGAGDDISLEAVQRAYFGSDGEVQGGT